jgi:UDP-2-acetamido-3-amino-2,3-dideoxy-glucuronate N-acetyltransferase
MTARESKFPVVQRLELTRHLSEFGLLVACQAPSQLPFTPARFFFIQGVPDGQVRGGHAHRECEQLLIAVRGRVEVMWEDAQGEFRFLLEEPGTALYIPPLVWAQQTYVGSDSLLLVMASDMYDPHDYIDSPLEARRLRSNVA